MKKTKKQILLEFTETLKGDIEQAIFFQEMAKNNHPEMSLDKNKYFLMWKDIEEKLRNVLLDSLKKIKQL